MKQLAIRLLVLLTLLTGTLYVGWRWLYSVNWVNWWIAVPLVVAETYSLVDSYLADGSEDHIRSLMAAEGMSER